MKKSLIFITCVWVLVNANINVKVYAAPIEQPITGITTVLDKVNEQDIKKLLDIKYEYTTDRINLRQESSVNSDIVTKIDKREKVQTISSSNGWSRVKYKDHEGYVKSEYLRDTELPSLEFTDDEIELMAKILWLEARGEKDDSGLAAVIICIVNRVKSEAFPDTIYEVLSQKNAFATWKLLDTANPTEREMEITLEVVKNQWKKLLTDDTVYFSTEPINKNVTAHIGNHWFCAED